MSFGLKNGLDLHALYEVITGSAGNSWMFENRGQHILDGDYTPHSAIDIFVKDLGIVLDTGSQLRFPLPLVAAASQLFTMAASKGWGAARRRGRRQGIRSVIRYRPTQRPSPIDRPLEG